MVGKASAAFKDEYHHNNDTTHSANSKPSLQSVQSFSSAVSSSEVVSDVSSDSTNSMKVNEVDVKSLPVWPAAASTFLVMSALSLAMPLYGFVLLHDPHLHDMDEAVTYSIAQRNVAIAAGMNAFFELLSAGVLGVLCDRIGRRPIAIMTQLGQVIDYTVAAFCADPKNARFREYIFSEPAIAIIAARSVAGILGNFKVPLSAYVADISTAESAAMNYGKVAIATGLGLITGPVISIIVLKWSQNHLRPPLLMAALLSLLNMALMYWKWPLTKASDDEAVSWADANPYLLVKNTVMRTLRLKLFGVMNFLDAFALHIIFSTLSVFTKAQFNWNPILLAVFFLCFGILTPLQMTFVMKPLLKLKGEAFVLKVGYGATTFAYLCLFGFGLTHIGNLMFVFVIFFTLGLISNPTQTSLAIQELPPSELGRLSGGLSLLETLGKAAAPLIGSAILSKSLTGPLPSLVYLVSALTMLPAFGLAFCIRSKKAEDVSEADFGDKSAEVSEQP
eukprot:TRINITY_DN8044_c0_g1_i1.p1 TRINITY_DN8044_c0_g1~~TRINITY_DN8044_c0_g1_i1.p1  ORF type:complete len:505 (-),score=71.14 TRINITY_DN8044_c0_g1_i1:629-2143(-)